MANSQSLFAELPEYWEEHWWGMPEFSHEDLRPIKQITLSFATEEEMAVFSRMVEQVIGFSTKSVWFKPQAIGTYRDKSYE